MSTRSNIGILNRDGSVDMIYCHWDGYPSNNGRILLQSYPDVEKIRKLIKLGDLSSLGEEIGTKHDFDFNMKLQPDSPEYQRLEKMCNAFGRDRGEEGVGYTHFPNIKRAIKAYRDGWAEYFYLFYEKEGYWAYMHGSAPFTTLTKKACKED